tara:strand:- start:929 stop:1849 length:921 start_codon:yes stop_codon:yes gene_type:complete
MLLKPSNQTNLYGLENNLSELINLYNKNKFPNKILLSGQKGIGKCTLAYHFINYVLSIDEDFSYDLEKNKINLENKSFKLIQNQSNPNFTIIDILPDKKMIEIGQIRNLILNMNKSSFNSKPRFVLIDNIEYLNQNSVNALLKTLEEPNENIFFILIHNQKNVLSTLKSRCLDFKVFFTNQKSLEITNQILEDDIYEIVNKDLLNYYITPGNIYCLVKFSQENKIDLKNINLNLFLKTIIRENYYKKNNQIKYFLFDFIELFLMKTSNLLKFENHSYFLKKIYEMKKFNLDEESFFIEFESKILNG